MGNLRSLTNSFLKSKSHSNSFKKQNKIKRPQRKNLMGLNTMPTNPEVSQTPETI